jgi:hypothetical protein
VVVPKIAAKAAPEPKLPLTFQTQLTLDDWTAAVLVANRPLTDINRSRLLTVFLPLLWFGMILGSFAGWRPARSQLTLSQFGTFLGEFVGDVPFYLLLVLTAGVVAFYLVHPWRMRRAMKSALSAAGFAQPIPLHYRVAEDGLTTRDPGRESFVPWSRFKRVEAGPSHLILVLPAHEETIAIPRRAVPAGEAEALQHLFESHAGAPQDALPPVEPPAGALLFEVTLQPEDRAAPVAWLQEQPGLRRKRLLDIARNWLLACLLAPALAILAWAFDPERLPVSLALPIFWALFPALFWQPAALFGALAILRAAFDRPLMRWFARHTGEILQRSASNHVQRFAADDDGILVEELGGYTRVGWAGVEGIERLAGHWLVRISRGSTLIVPRRELDADEARQLEALFSRHIRQV